MKKNQFKKLFAVMAFAIMLGATAISTLTSPVFAITQSINNTIQIGASVSAVSVGDDYTIPTATIKADGTYTQIVEVSHEIYGKQPLKEANTKVNARYSGNYFVEYTFVKDGNADIKYYANTKFVASVATGAFKFPTNVAQILPSKVDKTNIKPITLPWPTVVDNQGNQIIGADIKATLVKPDYTKIDFTSSQELISLASGNIALGEYKVIYTAKQNGITMVQNKTFSITVVEDYKGYTLEYAFLTRPTAWELGEEKELPTVTGKAKRDKNIVEEIEVYYTVSVKYIKDGSPIAINADELTGTKFKPSKVGNYEITYTVKDAFGNTSTYADMLIVKVSDNKNPVPVAVEPYAVDATEHVNAENKIVDISASNLIIPAIWGEDQGTIKFADFKSLKRRIQYRGVNDIVVKINGENKTITNLDDVFTDSQNANKNLVFNQTGTSSETDFFTAINLPDGDYRVYYEITDNSGKNDSKYYDFKVDVDFVWTEAPTAEFVGTIPTEVVLGDTIKFDKPKFKDAVDTRLETKVEYSLTLNDAPLKDFPKVLEIKEDGKYEIKLPTTTTATKIVITISATNNRVTAVDSEKTTSTTKEISIININDTETPAVTNAESAPTNVKQGETISIPEVTIDDDYAQYLEMSVKAFNISSKGVRTEVACNNATPLLTGQRSLKIVGGKITCSLIGDYEIEYRVQDTSGKVAVHFIKFSVTLNPELTEPAIKGLEGYTGASVKLGAKLTLPVATLINPNPGIITASYRVEMFESESSNYQLSNTTFKPMAEGTYKIMYIATFNDQTNPVKEVNAGPFVITVADETKPTDPQISEFIEINENNYNYIGQNVLNFSIEKDIYEPVRTANGLEATEIPTTIQIKNWFKSNSITKEITLPSVVELGYKLTIPTFSGTDAETGINLEKSTVVISSSNFGSRTIKLSEINTASSQLYLTLTKNDVYSITYTLVDNAKFATANQSSYTHVISSGDTQSPTLKLADDIVKNSYKKGSDLIIDRNKILTATDNKSSLTKADVVVKVKNISLDKIVEVSSVADKYSITSAGDYEVTFSLTDSGGHTTSITKTFTVSAEENAGTNATKIIGTVLIVITAVILVGVVVYFIVTKRRNDKIFKNK
ncbi:MAG: hypothetical protein RR140_03175 [Clostridia bacterium]